MSERPPVLFWGLLPLCLALSGFFTAYIFLSFIFRLPGPLVLCRVAPLAAIIVGVPGWYYVIVQPRRATIKRGLMLGVLGSLSAHLILWIGAAVVVRPSSLGPSTIIFWTIASLLYAGWFTALCGAFTGVFLVILQRALTYLFHEVV